MPKTTSPAPWLAEGEEKRRKVQSMFADIAPSYDLVNSLMCFRLHHRWRSKAVEKLALNPGDQALDVCCGTGDFLVPLRQKVSSTGKVHGVDFCAPMLEVAKKKLGEEAQVALGDACNLPITSDSYDAVSVGWGLRNVPDVPAALTEIVRVLRRGGRFVSLDMARPRGKVLGAVSEWVMHRVVPTIGRVFGKSVAYTYLPKSTLKFMSREELVSAMQSAGFEKVGYKDMFFGNICMHWGVKR